MKISAILKIIAQAIIGYLMVWCLAYVAMMLSRGDRPEFRECYEYFILAWTFQAGELPGFIWLLSLGGFALLWGVLIFMKARNGRHQ